MSNYGAKAYHKTSIETASKEKILLMLYEGCIRYLKKAKIAMESKQIAEKGMNIGKAQDIVNELSNTLNHSIGGDLTKQLEALYIFIFNRTTEANINNDPKAIDDCIKILETLYSGWSEAIASLKKGPAAASSATPDTSPSNTNSTNEPALPPSEGLKK